MLHFHRAESEVGYEKLQELMVADAVDAEANGMVSTAIILAMNKMIRFIVLLSVVGL